MLEVCPDGELSSQALQGNTLVGPSDCDRSDEQRQPELSPTLLPSVEAA